MCPLVHAPPVMEFDIARYIKGLNALLMMMMMGTYWFNQVNRSAFPFFVLTTAAPAE
jgi:hypothetical protein